MADAIATLSTSRSGHHLEVSKYWCNSLLERPRTALGHERRYVPGLRLHLPNRGHPRANTPASAECRTTDSQRFDAAAPIQPLQACVNPRLEISATPPAWSGRGCAPARRRAAQNNRAEGARHAGRIGVLRGVERVRNVARLRYATLRPLVRLRRRRIVGLLVPQLD